MTTTPRARAAWMVLATELGLLLGCSVSFEPLQSSTPESSAGPSAAVVDSEADSNTSEPSDADPATAAPPRSTAPPSDPGALAENVPDAPEPNEPVREENEAPTAPPETPPTEVATSVPAENPPVASEPAAITPEATAPVASVAPSAPRQIKEIPQDPAVTIDLTFDDIKFDMEKGAPFHRAMVTGDIERYHDRTIKIRGYILPGFQERGISQFVLVRDNMECCFGPGAALYDCIFVTMAPGVTLDYTVRPISVEGIFAIDPFLGPEGYPLAIYRIQGLRAQ